MPLGSTQYTIGELNEQLDLVIYEADKEREFIESENLRITKETGKRKRQTTSKRLKELEYEAKKLSNKIRMFENIENQIKQLTPQWIINKIVDTENKDW